MLKSDLINILVVKRGVTQKQAEATIETIFDSMKDALCKGENIEIRGLGAFHVKHYEGYQGRNPKTGEVIPVRPKRGILFRTGKELRDRVNRPELLTKPPGGGEDAGKRRGRGAGDAAGRRRRLTRRHRCEAARGPDLRSRPRCRARARQESILHGRQERPHFASQSASPEFMPARPRAPRDRAGSPAAPAGAPRRPAPRSSGIAGR